MSISPGTTVYFDQSRTWAPFAALVLNASTFVILPASTWMAWSSSTLPCSTSTMWPAWMIVSAWAAVVRKAARSATEMIDSSNVILAFRNMNCRDSRRATASRKFRHSGESGDDEQESGTYKGDSVQSSPHRLKLAARTLQVFDRICLLALA